MNIAFPGFFCLLLLAFLVCCESSDKPINKFSDPVILRIAEYQDRRAADSLYPFFNHENAVYRRESVLAFGSLQDASNVDRIGKLLVMDSDPSVRRAAAFALGQIQDPSCERMLLGAMVKEKIPENTAAILQAYGKTTRKWKLEPDVFLNDSTKTSGLAWSLYRAGLRGKADSVANGVAKRLLDKEYSGSTRLGAAHYFARGAIDFQDAEANLIDAAGNDALPEVRMAATLALGKITSDASREALKKIIKSESDARVIVNALRALASFPFDPVKHYLYEALKHKDANVGIAASEVILEILPPDDWIEVSSLTNQVTQSRILANLYEAALKAGKSKEIAAEIQSHYEKASEPCDRAALLGSLKHFPGAFPFVEAELLKADTLIVRSTAATTLVGMNYSESFSATLKPRFAAQFKTLMQSQEDPAVLGIIASAFADSTLGYDQIVKDAGFLYEARNKLRLPEHNESLQAIEAAIAHIEGKKVLPVKNEFNHPIDWGLVQKIPEDQRVTIRTTRGSIVLRLLVNESPGSVANFLTLAQSGYFDNKYFHRVVPNFVVQSGCKRGDGWGSEDYSIRSEFSLRPYKGGSVGMASAGKDTEGTQWFITHSPTPHLDGRYSLFAEVEEGMPVVNYIQVGDKITDVVIENFITQ